jgi:hypothetical protein
MKRFLPFCALALAACSDPVLGHWEADNDKVELDFETSDEAAYEGKGNIYLRAEADPDRQVYCAFEFAAFVEDGDVIELEGKFIGDCKDFGKFDDFDCTLVSGPLLECETPDGHEVTYRREGDVQ